MDKQKAKSSISNFIKCRTRDECPVDECCDCDFFGTYAEVNEALKIAILCIEWVMTFENMSDYLYTGSKVDWSSEDE